MFMDWNVEYCQHVNITQSDRCNNCQNSKKSVLLAEIEQLIVKFTWNLREAQLAEIISKEQSQRTHTPLFQSYRNQNIVVQA